MTKEHFNILVLVFQIVISILLSIYLIVPVFDLEEDKLWGDNVHSPYENWKQSPLTQIKLEDNSLLLGDSVLSRIYPFKGIDGLYVLDNEEASVYNPFLLGKSIQDIQFLLKHNQEEILLYNPATNESNEGFDKLKAIDLMILPNTENLSILDRHLNMGHTLSLLAGESDSLFCYNQLLSVSDNKQDLFRTLEEGRNLLMFSKEDLNNTNIEYIPAIREINWKETEFYIDLSEIGRIQITSSDYRLDTLSQSLKIRLPNVSWFRFQVNFENDNFQYISNPYYRYNEAALTSSTIKANNQLTIFINLSWLIGIILVNLFFNYLRGKYLKSTS